MKKFSDTQRPSQSYNQTYAPPGHSGPFGRGRSTGQRIATIKNIPGGIMLEVSFPYDKTLIDAMTTSIPAKQRTWDNAHKVWYIWKQQFDVISHLLQKYCDEVLLLDFPAPEVAADNWTKLMLVEGAPMELVQAAYRILSKLHHPDHGGDVEKMKDINVAYKALMGEFATKDDEKNGD